MLYHIAVGPALDGKIPPGDLRWSSFNGSFRNQQLNQVDIASRLYDGHPITTCCKPEWRKSENYYRGQHLGLDFDTEDKRSAMATLLKEPFISKYGSIIYTTPSHTPDKPRARVMFLMDTPIHQAVNYTMAATALLWVFGNADRQCKDPVRFWYGAKPGAGEMEWLDNELPLDLVKDLIQRYQTSGRQERRRVYRPRDTDPHDITSALKAIDPWAIPYDEWLSILMALHSEMGDAGLSLAEHWADGRPHEVEQKWRSFNSNGNLSGKVTLGTLFAIAKRHGWTR